jgi:hypothetical protein
VPDGQILHSLAASLLLNRETAGNCMFSLIVSGWKALSSTRWKPCLHAISLRFRRLTWSSEKPIHLYSRRFSHAA